MPTRVNYDKIWMGAIQGHFLLEMRLGGIGYCVIF